MSDFIELSQISDVGFALAANHIRTENRLASIGLETDLAPAGTQPNATVLTTGEFVLSRSGGEITATQETMILRPGGGTGDRDYWWREYPGYADQNCYPSNIRWTRYPEIGEDNHFDRPNSAESVFKAHETEPDLIAPQHVPKTETDGEFLLDGTYDFREATAYIVVHGSVVHTTDPAHPVAPIAGHGGIEVITPVGSYDIPNDLDRMTPSGIRPNPVTRKSVGNREFDPAEDQPLHVKSVGWRRAVGDGSVVTVSNPYAIALPEIGPRDQVLKTPNSTATVLSRVVVANDITEAARTLQSLSVSD